MLSLHAVPPTEADREPRGYSSILQLEPDLGAFERINVGVMVVSARGARFVRTLDHFERLSCLYGPGVVEMLEFTTTLARETLIAGQPLRGHSIVMTQQEPFFNIDPEVYVGQLFARVVAAARPTREASTEQAARRSTEGLWKDVGDILKREWPERADDIIAVSPYTTVETRRGPQQICVPLTPRGGAGALESADWQPQLTELKLMRALLDVEVAVETRRLPALGFFVGRPVRRRDQDSLIRIDRAIDSVAARVPSDATVEVSDSAPILARAIADWAASVTSSSVADRLAE